MKRRSDKEARASAKPYGLDTASYEALKRWVIDGIEAPYSIALILESAGLISPTGGLMADAFSIFYQEE